MPRNPKNLIYHELIGLPVEAHSYKSKNPSNVPVVGGIVIDETRQTLVVETRKKKRKIIIKATHAFRFTLDQPAGPVIVEVDGKLLWGRPEKRLKKLRKKW